MPTEPLIQEIERAFPERPFTIELWDGSKVPSTNGGGPTFKARSQDDLAYAVAAPGQLGLGRAYVSGEIEIHVGDESYQLKAGDGFHLRSDLPHTVFNRGDAPAVIVWVTTHTPSGGSLMS